MRHATNSLSALVLMAACLCASPVETRAQNEAVPAEGRPALTRRTADDVAGFFEWLLEARLTSGQRRELDRILVSAWERADREEMEAVSKFGEFNSKLAAAPEATRAEVREALRPDILRQLRGDTGDLARLVLMVYESKTDANLARAENASQSESALRGSDADAGADNNVAAGGASELAGSWRASELGGVSYQNTVTGASKPGRGTTRQYRFLPGGRFEYNGYLETTTYNCTTTLFNPTTGTYRVEGARLVLMPQSNKWQQRNNCASSTNKELPGKLDSQAYSWRVSIEQGRRNLCLTSAGGTEVCYRQELRSDAKPSPPVTSETTAQRLRR